MIKVKLLNIKNQKESFKKTIICEDFITLINDLIEENAFEISFAGFHNASNFLFAYAVGKELELILQVLINLILQF